jgi:hypothetical protein
MLSPRYMAPSVNVNFIFGNPQLGMLLPTERRQGVCVGEGGGMRVCGTGDFERVGG